MKKEVIVSKRKSVTCHTKNVHTRIQQVEYLNIYVVFLTKAGKCDTEMRRRIWIAKDDFEIEANYLETYRFPYTQ